MDLPLQGIRDHQLIHHSIGVILTQGGAETLLLQLTSGTYVGIGGHQRTSEKHTPADAAKRITVSRTGLALGSCQLLGHRFADADRCHMGIDGHSWALYQATATEGTGTTPRTDLHNRRVASIAWHDIQGLHALPLSPIWRTWFNLLVPN